jgi:GNAT superfamily N-acetyltransferase
MSTSIRVIDPRSGTVDEEHRDLARHAYETVLVPSFSADELVSLEELTEGLASGDLSMLVASDDEDGIVGAAVTERIAGPDVDLLAYLAARPGLRSRGVGTRLIDELRARWRETPACRLVLGEIHDPRRWPEQPDERPGARLEFYRRNGCEVLTAPWIQPALGDGTDRVRDMLLIVLHSTLPDPLGPEGERQLSTTVSAWAGAYFDACEGPEPVDDDRRALMARLAEPLRIVPLEEYRERTPLLRTP